MHLFDSLFIFCRNHPQRSERFHPQSPAAELLRTHNVLLLERHIIQVTKALIIFRLERYQHPVFSSVHREPHQTSHVKDQESNGCRTQRPKLGVDFHGKPLKVRALKNFCVNSSLEGPCANTMVWTENSHTDLYLLIVCPCDKYFISHCTISGMSMLSLHCLKTADTSGNLKYALRMEYYTWTGNSLLTGKEVVFYIDFVMYSYKLM